MATTIWPLHPVEDEDYVEQLKSSIAENGWRGVSLVLYAGEQLVTGSHRFAACRQLGWDYDEIPTVDLADLIAEHLGMTEDDLATELWGDKWGPVNQTIDSRAVELALELPEEVKDKYGIDCG